MFDWFHKKAPSISLSESLKAYEQLSFVPDSSTPIEQTKFVVLDCETTGLTKSDRIVTVGAVKCTAKDIFIGQVLDQKYPEAVVGKSAEIHGELPMHQSDDPYQLIDELIEYISNHVLVGHNISFDVAMLNALVKRSYGIQLKNKVLDTAQMAMRLDPVKYERTVGGQSQLHLDDLCKAYQIPIENRHTALGDAYLTARLFQKLWTQLRKREVDIFKMITH